MIFANNIFVVEDQEIIQLEVQKNVSWPIMKEVIETILAHFYHIYCMMNNILYVMSYS